MRSRDTYSVIITLMQVELYYCFYILVLITLSLVDFMIKNEEAYQLINYVMNTY